jgi:hypothetical protein
VHLENPLGVGFKQCSAAPQALFGFCGQGGLAEIKFAGFLFLVQLFAGKTPCDFFRCRDMT